MNHRAVTIAHTRRTWSILTATKILNQTQVFIGEVKWGRMSLTQLNNWVKRCTQRSVHQDRVPYRSGECEVPAEVFYLYGKIRKYPIFKWTKRNYVSFKFINRLSLPWRDPQILASSKRMYTCQCQSGRRIFFLIRCSTYWRQFFVRTVFKNAYELITDAPCYFVSELMYGCFLVISEVLTSLCAQIITPLILWRLLVTSIECV